ncbi:probable GPI ethanolamine phosphate transferase 3 [Rhynchosporium agropyri]|uniref:GPI ethanolamine phosphate transferase 2 n=1 Tax=Rhynchosporium agropyri TaxID=914238 RepID=A0A1E1L853_9HELO|nr:probable GPI ethanolamine phosphate transferase 3 [Rhynchosporium agropyri]
MASRTSTLLLLAANILVPIAISIFASGFFPYKPFLPGLAQYETLEYGPPPEAPFDRVIFMVVDALRSDFVYSNNSGFLFTQSLIQNGEAIPFTAHATSPTITMPRIKAITTGSTPSFLDLILNFAESDTSSTLATQDTWLAQMKAKGTGKMIMYGDDTWLKLFPETFDRADGTSSFFVSVSRDPVTIRRRVPENILIQDFTEVDNNVTRHVPEELRNDDWNTMVLHYLGLDHIGHKTGPRGPNMIPKQHEMDGIVKLIYEAMTNKQHLQSTLLVLAGDHGMNDAGNHGGSAPGETSPALVFIAPKLRSINSGHVSPAEFQEDFHYYFKVEQSDIAPTLGSLLGFPAPRNNLGAMIPNFLPFWPKKSDQVQILSRNARQILGVVTAAFPPFKGASHSNNCKDLSEDIDQLACQWKIIDETEPSLKDKDYDIDVWIQITTKWLKDAQDIMSGTASNYDVRKLASGQATSTVALLLALAAAFPTLSKSFKESTPILLISLLYGIMMFASSYVEEEQHFWFWATSAWLVLLWVKCARKKSQNTVSLAASSILVLIVARFGRRWNQTGQKWAGEPDIARTFFSEHRLTLWAFVGLTYLWILQSLTSRAFHRFPQVAAAGISTALVTAALTFKLAFTNEDSPELMAGIVKYMADSEAGAGASLIGRARFALIAIGIVLIYTIGSGFGHEKRPNPTMRTIHDLLTLFLVTQSRATNIPLILLFEIQFYLLNDLDLTLVEISTTSLLLQYMSFFAFGGSNAISSIDLSSAYNGVSGYNALAVGILTFASNWTGPIFWTSATTIMLLRLRRKSVGLKGSEERKNILQQHLSLRTVFVTSSLVFVMAACTLLRTHLFIWTVFSPKYLYSMAWSIGQHLGVNVGLGGLLYWLGTMYE